MQAISRLSEKIDTTTPGGKLLTRVCRGFFRLLLALASIFLLGMLAQILLRTIALRNKELRVKLLKPYDAVILKMAGGPFSPYAVLTHIGRRSGRAYQTPLGNGFVLGLAFGADADWCRNVMAAGKCTMPYRILCNVTFQISQEARSGRDLASPRCTSLHNN